MQTSTQVYRNLKAAEFSEPQARTLVDILQAADIGALACDNLYWVISDFLNPGFYALRHLPFSR
jgi:hypothetical protein